MLLSALTFVVQTSSVSFVRLCVSLLLHLGSSQSGTSHYILLAFQER